MSHQMLRPFIFKVSLLGYFPLIGCKNMINKTMIHSVNTPFICV